MLSQNHNHIESILDQSGRDTFEYVMFQRQPVDYENIGDHEAIGIYQNAETMILLYQERMERSKAVILARGREREINSIPDKDFQCDIVSEDSVLVNWLPGHGPWERNRA